MCARRCLAMSAGPSGGVALLARLRKETNLSMARCMPLPYTHTQAHDSVADARNDLSVCVGAALCGWLCVVDHGGAGARRRWRRRVGRTMLQRWRGWRRGRPSWARPKRPRSRAARPPTAPSRSSAPPRPPRASSRYRRASVVLVLEMWKVHACFCASVYVCVHLFLSFCVPVPYASLSLCVTEGSCVRGEARSTARPTLRRAARTFAHWQRV
jgi:hypothetical protein